MFVHVAHFGNLGCKTFQTETVHITTLLSGAYIILKKDCKDI